jgi:hypothetical protein
MAAAAHNPKFAHPALLPQAEVGMGNYDKAQKDLDILLPQNPKDAELLYVKTQITCWRISAASRSAGRQ